MVRDARCREHVSGRFGKIKCLARPIVAPGPFHLVCSCRLSLGRNKRRTATSCSVLGSRILRRRSSFSAYRREMDPQARACSVLPSARRQHFRSPTWLPWLHTLWTPFEQARTVPRLDEYFAPTALRRVGWRPHYRVYRALWRERRVAGCSRGQGGSG